MALNLDEEKSSAPGDYNRSDKWDVSEVASISGFSLDKFKSSLKFNT